MGDDLNPVRERHSAPILLQIKNKPGSTRRGSDEDRPRREGDESHPDETAHRVGVHRDGG